MIQLDRTQLLFQNLGEIWRDVTAIEFLMRCAIMKYDGEESYFPKPPYKIGKLYNPYPKAFTHLSFEMVVAKFNKRFPKIAIPEELIRLRDAMAHGITAEINKSGTMQLLKFKEMENPKGLKVEFNLNLELEKITQMKQSLVEIRRSIAVNIT